MVIVQLSMRKIHTNYIFTHTKPRYWKVHAGWWAMKVLATVFTKTHIHRFCNKMRH